LDHQVLVASTIQRRTGPQRLTFDALDLGAAALDVDLVEAGGMQPVPHGTGVVAAVEVQDTGLGEQAGLVDGIEDGLEQGRCWVAPGSKPGPTRRPVDGHLSAAPEDLSG
jgi:hypothetical protein